MNLRILPFKFFDFPGSNKRAGIWVLPMALLMLWGVEGGTRAQELAWKTLDGPWGQTQGSYDGAVRSIAITPHGTIFAGTNGGVFRSSDDGASWQETNSGLTRPFVSALVVTKQGHILAGSDSPLFRSQNNGDSWSEVYDAFESLTGLALGVEDRIYLAAGGGVHRSLNGGATWSPVGLAGRLVMSILARLENGVEVIYAGTNQDGIFRSSDGGTSWQLLGLAGMQIPSLASRTDGLLAAGTEFGVYLSSDGGQTWNKAPMPRDGIYVYTLAFGIDGALLVGEFGGVYRSTDSGQTWTKHDFVASTMIAIAVHTEGRVFVGTGDKGLFRSHDHGQTWTEINQGLTTMAITGLALAPDGKFYAAARGSGIFRSPGVFRSTDHGETWEEFATGLENLMVRTLAVDAARAVYAGVENSGVYRLDQGASTWVRTNSPRSHSPNALITDAGDALYLGDEQSVYRSTDQGESWPRLGLGDLPQVQALAIDANGAVFAGTSDGVYHLAHENATWTATNLTGMSVLALALDQHAVYAGAEAKGLFRSTDGGASWQGVALADRSVTALTIGPHGDLFAGAEYNGVYASSDGLTWKAYNAGLLIDRAVTALAFDSSSYLFAGTEVYGIYRSISPVNKLPNSVKQAQAMPVYFALEQNYPNPLPVHASTTITFVLAIPSHVRLTVHDLLGRELKMLMDEWRPAGRHQLPLDARTLPSGAYFYRMEIAGKMLIRKMMVSK